MEMWMRVRWQTWSLVSASVLVLLLFGRLDLLALVVPFSVAVGYGAWLAQRGNASRGR
jgi:hypothetical protein